MGPLRNYLKQAVLWMINGGTKENFSIAFKGYSCLNQGTLFEDEPRLHPKIAGISSSPPNDRECRISCDGKWMDGYDDLKVVQTPSLQAYKSHILCLSSIIGLKRSQQTYSHPLLTWWIKHNRNDIKGKYCHWWFRLYYHYWPQNSSLEHVQ